MSPCRFLMGLTWWAVLQASFAADVNIRKNIILYTYVNSKMFCIKVIGVGQTPVFRASEPSIRDGVLRSGMLLYLHLILKQDIFSSCKV